VVGILEVEFGKHRGTIEGGKSRADEWQGVLFFTVILFSAQKSMHGLSDPSFFFTKKNPAPTEEEDGLISPAARVSWMYLSIASCAGIERFNNRLLGKGAPGWRSKAQSYG
jgi:hypothetical protein